MEDMADYQHENDILLRLIKKIIEMTPAERLGLVEKLEELPVNDLSLGERDGIRRLYEQTVTFSTQDRLYTAVCKDISNGGVFIQTQDVFQMGQLVTLDIPFSSKNESIKIPAEIVRVDAQGIGLKFLKKDNITYV
jgi:Tfp pilus assembly protein PilZ